MDTFIIKVPQNKTALVKALLKELGVSMKKESEAMLVAKEINGSIKAGKKPTMKEIVEETRIVRHQH